MKREDFYFNLPSELIAQQPSISRDSSRLIVVDAAAKTFFHSYISKLPQLIPSETICVPNNVKVRRARLILRKNSGGYCEALLLHQISCGCFEALVKPGRYFQVGKRVQVVDPLSNNTVAELVVEKILNEGIRVIRLFNNSGHLNWDSVDCIGKMPLPHYIKQQILPQDENRYQTVFHNDDGEAIAAPTAGLHFTNELITQLKQLGCIWSPICLHVGLGTFRPLVVDNIEDHSMHTERYEISEATANTLYKAISQKTNPILAIGTTSLRTMEAAWNGVEIKRKGITKLFIQPGYDIRTANMLLTNFHLPESTLFILISAILGLKFAHSIYTEAIREQYKFFSYGDAMLIINIR